MRIIRGKFKGRKIILPKGFKSRPTTDFAKEALFNILDNNYQLQHAVVLDLFAGTGSISYEFLSEGCKKVTAVDISRNYTVHIKKQFDEMFPLRGNIICADVFKLCKNQKLDYDIIFADPPFQNENINELPELIFNNLTLKENTLFILEHSKRNDFTKNRYFKEIRIYGNVRFSFFSKK